MLQIVFKKMDSDLFCDEVVELSAASQEELIDDIHSLFCEFKLTGVIRSPASRTNSSAYEDDYLKLNDYLCTKCWEKLTLQEATCLFGYLGCVSRNEFLSALPSMMELMLKADRFVAPFEFLFLYLSNEAKSQTFSYPPKVNTALRKFLETIQGKFAGQIPPGTAVSIERVLLTLP